MKRNTKKAHLLKETRHELSQSDAAIVNLTNTISRCLSTVVKAANVIYSILKESRRYHVEDRKIIPIILVG